MRREWRHIDGWGGSEGTLMDEEGVMAHWWMRRGWWHTDVWFQVIDEEGLQQNSHEVGTYFIEELAKLRDEFEEVGDVRGKGLMIGVEMVKDKVSKYVAF
jgi:hypothetical protein